ncbi:MAG: DUF1302 family protein [Myxococcota bacterium]|nr:DUF1302 family protein [Myxococcota bacterium]
MSRRECVIAWRRVPCGALRADVWLRPRRPAVGGGLMNQGAVLRRVEPRHPLWVALVLGVGLLFLPRPGAAFEAIDGRLEAHGYFEMQIRTISQNFSDQWDLTQWYNVFNLELELDLVQDTHGPLDLMSAFIRIEARFDCVYSRGCGMIRSADLYGNRARDMPRRLNSGDEYTNAGSIVIKNDGPYAGPNRNPFKLQETPVFRGIYEGIDEGPGSINRGIQLRCITPSVGADGSSANSSCTPAQANYKAGRLPARFWDADRNKRVRGPNGMPVDDGTNGAPFLLAMENFKDFEFSTIKWQGGGNNGHPILPLGPWLPENYVEPNASLSNVPNPLDASRISPQSLANGFGANPMRPIPIYRENDPYASQIYVYQETNPANPSESFTPTGRWQTINPESGQFSDIRPWNDRSGQGTEARGIFMPTAPLRKGMAEGKFDSYPFNFSQMERAWNRGSSQQDEGELKEAYVDIEMFDYRLWLRLGKQNIVWGKTELFRTTDQFNPQDYALATLPSLEESRIGLWSARGVWSFYDVGPLADVRLELAMNFDEFESADLGTCGEPYAVTPVCLLTFGAFAHGFLGVGVAGVEQPPNPFDDASGLEYGARLEWRWDRFSFSISDFYGYADFPHLVRISSYGRNVDWRSGRPRFLMDDVAVMASGASDCAAPGYLNEEGQAITAGVAYRDPGTETIRPWDPNSGGGENTQAPNVVGAGITYESKDGYVRAGCLTPGATNRQMRVMMVEGDKTPSGETEYYGTPSRISWMPVTGEDLDGTGYSAYRRNNTEYSVAGRFMNDTAYSDPHDPRRDYSIATPDRFEDLTLEDWKEGPQAYLCDSPGSPLNQGGVSPEGCDPERRGRRSYNTQKYIEWNGENVPNPEFNPYYDPRFDRYFDASQVPASGDAWFLGQDTVFLNEDEQRDALLNYPSFSPGSVFTRDPKPFDAFELDPRTQTRGGIRSLFSQENAYNPNLETFDSRNALDQSPVNAGLFNWVCAVTVGFADLDPSACALTVFSSSKEPAGQGQDGASPRISTLISAFVQGNYGFNGFLGQFPSDELLSKGPILPFGMAMPLLYLHEDFAPEENAVFREQLGRGLNAFRTYDVRQQWAYESAQVADPTIYQPYIYSREGESYNCLGNYPMFPGRGVQLCGGLEINGELTQPTQKFRVGTFLGRVLTPEQEALLGCGPFYGTSCDANGADLMWAEASALTQSFIGSDSIGISFVDLGIADLVPESFGTHLMDNGSFAEEYRADGRVVGKNGHLLRIEQPWELVENPDEGAPVYKRLGPEDWYVAAGSGGLLENGALPNPNLMDPLNLYTTEKAGYDLDQPCEITTASLYQENDQGVRVLSPTDRTRARCWDLRPYYMAYGLQPGTATFDILQLGGPKCTTADIGGPQHPLAGVLPGCRNKWATVLYKPLEDWAGSFLQPNNPDAGYIGNNWYGQVFSWRASKTVTKFNLQYLADGEDPEISWTAHARFDTEAAPDARKDYRQWADPDGDFTQEDSLAHQIPCGTGNGEATNPGSQDDPQNYDCYINDPSQGSPQGNPLASVSLPTGWTPATPGWEVGSSRYALALESKGSGLNWGVFDVVTSGCDPNGTFSDAQLRNNADCYVGGWRQTVDGDPDRVGLYKPLLKTDPATGQQIPEYTPRYPKYVKAEGLGYMANVSPLEKSFYDYGDRVEVGCTTGENWAFTQLHVSGKLLPMMDCAEVYQGNPFASVTNRGSSGHIFTGESMANELAAASANLGGGVLVALSSEFTDMLASIRGYVNPEMYESRYIYDEDWMWDFTCDGITGCRPEDDYEGRTFVGKPLPIGGSGGSPNNIPWYPNFEAPDPALYGKNCNDPAVIAAGGSCGYSAYGDPNRLVSNLATPTYENGGRIRQVAGLQVSGINNVGAGANFNNPNSPPDKAAWENYLRLRGQKVVSELPEGEENKLQRDPSLRNVLTDFPDLLQRECLSARAGYRDGMSAAEVRELYENCGKITASGGGGRLDWDAAGQAKRLGNVSGQGGLLETMLWDAAFSAGREGDLISMIPYCEGLGYSQRNVRDLQQDVVGVEPEPYLWGANRIDCTRGMEGEVLGAKRCNFVTPQYCGLVQALSGIAGQKRNIMRAGGNGRFGRKTAQWQSGGEAYLAYEKRNVLGFSMDFAEDVSKSNWSVEFTWIEGMPQFDADAYNYNTKVDDFNLTVSVDRPTFINFLNANRTFFINSQWFFQYRKGWEESFASIGPWNVLATFAVFTGFFQDRLNPQLVFVYDFRSNSGGALPQVNYRFSENFSITVGAALFAGESRYVTMPVNGLGPAGLQGGPHAYQDSTLPGLSIVRDRDEVFMVLRYTF